MGQRDIGCAQTWAAKADVGRHGIRHGHVRDTPAIWGNHGNPAVVQRGDAYITSTVDGQGVKFLIAGDSDEKMTAVDGSCPLDPYLAGFGDLPPPHSPRNGLCHVEAGPVW